LLGVSDSRDHAIAGLAEHQHGLFTATQADEIGLTRDQRAKRVTAGRWVLVHPGVYRIAGAPPSWRAELLAACWAAHSLAAASHRSAAVLWDVPGGTTDYIEVTCRRYRRTLVDGLVVHETKLLRPEDLEVIDGIPVTTIEQTLLGLAAVAGSTLAELALDRALHRKLTTRARLDDFVRAKGARGRNGIGVLRELLEQHDPFAGIPESVMETRMKQILRRHGLPTPEFQYVIRHQGVFVARVDAAYPELRIAIEYDSYEHHTGKDAIVRDNDRRNALREIEWDVVTFTAVDIANDGGTAMKALKKARSDAYGAARVP
jgi:very-short-patch-repair endonuclease